MFGFKIITQWEQGIVFRFGRALPGIRAPGLTWVNPFTDRLRKVNMQILVVAVPAQEAITIDNVTVRVDAVVYYRVVDPFKAIINVQDYHHAVSQVAQTSLRSVIGQNDLDQLLSGREKINAHLKDVIDAPTEEPWGILVERVELKDISLPESMKRSMSRQAEAERERRARVISADGEYQASTRLAEAATVMSADPAALQLRLLQTVGEVAAEKNSTLVMPFPVELLRFFDNAAPAPGRAQAAATDTGTADSTHQPAGVPALSADNPPVGVTLAGQLNGVPKMPAGQPRLRLRGSRACGRLPPASPAGRWRPGRPDSGPSISDGLKENRKLWTLPLRPSVTSPGGDKSMATFDARPVIAVGGEPFNDVMAAAASLGRDEELVGLVPFDPVPLKNVLGSRGFTGEAASLGEGNWRVTFRRPS